MANSNNGLNPAQQQLLQQLVRGNCRARHQHYWADGRGAQAAQNAANAAAQAAQQQALNVQQQQNAFLTNAALTQANCLQQCGGDAGAVAQRACAINCQENYITALQQQPNLSVQEAQALSQAQAQLQVEQQEQAAQTAEATEQIAQTVQQTTQETHQGLKNKSTSCVTDIACVARSR